MKEFVTEKRRPVNLDATMSDFAPAGNVASLAGSTRYSAGTSSPPRQARPKHHHAKSTDTAPHMQVRTIQIAAADDKTANLPDRFVK